MEDKARRAARGRLQYKHQLRALLLVAASAPALAAHAQVAATSAAAAVAAAGAPDAASATVQDVVVTATRQSTHIQKTPVAVAVISQALIAQQNITTTRDLAGHVAGLTLQRAGITPTTQVFFIRGVGDSDPIFDPTVAQYVDDVYLPRAINGMTDLTDIERVEVLRGPQGTLFGENAGGGAVRYITKTPTDKVEANFDFGGGAYGAFNAHGYLAGPLIPGVLDGGVAIAHDQHDGYTWDPTIGRHVNDQDTTGLRAKLAATFTPSLTAVLTLDGTLDHSASAYYTPERPIIGGTLKTPVYGAFQPNISYASQGPKNNSWTAGVSLRVSYAIDPNLTFNSISAYRGFAQDPVNYNNDGQPLVPYSPTSLTPVSISDNYIVYREQEATQELQLLGKYQRFDFTSGFYFFYEDFSSNRIGYVVSPAAATPAPAYPEDQIGDTKTTNYAIYAQGDYHLTDQLTATLGARYTIEHRDFAFQGVYDDFTGAPLPVTPGAPITTPGGFAAVNNFSYAGGKTWTSFTPKFGLSYQLTPDVFGYASVSRGFDAGGFNNRASSLATALPYNQENITTYEIGLKTDWFDRRLQVNGTVFYNDFSGLQETASVPSPITGGYVSVRSNAHQAHSEGVELETSAQPIDGLVLTGNVSYLWTRFDSFANAGAVAGKLVSATGNQLPLSPRWQLYGAFSYRLPLDLRGEVRIGADVTYESSYFSDVFNYPQGRVPDQGFVDASISYAPAGVPLTFSVIGRNLANRFAYQSITWGGTPNLWEGPMNPPRTIFVKAAYAY
ncbi:MAG: TonB-dependent receptor [Caulobacteraceae bacterium]|nr:TonB-dependent receptor [Caulobacteraceae bacterium]